MGYNYKSFKEIKEIDTISFKKNLDEINSFFKDKKDFLKEDKFDFYFPLENGVLKFKMKEVILYFYFNINGLMELYIYNYDEYFFEPCIALKFENVVNGEFKFKILENSRGYKIDKIDNFINIFIRVISYINFIKDNKNITIKSNRKKRIKVNNNSNEVKYKKRSVEFIEDNKVIYIASISEENFNKFKKYTRHTESWNVMGFVRHYKNGKTVWVKPHTRGNGNKSKKDYIVK